VEVSCLTRHQKCQITQYPSDILITSLPSHCTTRLRPSNRYENRPQVTKLRLTYPQQRSLTPEHFAPRATTTQSRQVETADSVSRSSSIYTADYGHVGEANLSAIWNPGQLVPDNNDATQQQFEHLSQTESATMSINGADSMSSDSGAPLDRFMQRRLQRLNTEQGFREQRQASLSQQSQAQHSKSSSLQQADPFHQQQQGHQHLQQQQQQQPPQRQQSLPDYADQPLPTRIPAQVIPSVPNSTATTPSSSSASPHSHFRHDTPQQPQYQPLRNFAKLHDDGPIQLSTSTLIKAQPRQPSMTSSNQSSAANAREPSILSQQQPQQPKDVGRSTPQPQAEDLNEDQVRSLLNDHRELRKLPTIPLSSVPMLTTPHSRRKVPKGQEVLFRKRGPGQATPKQSRSPANRPITYIPRRRRVCDSLQPSGRSDRTTVLQH
jgi:hypothetical protein